MIVDLIRNDLARISDPGSVRVPELFRVEAYPTLLQLTSTVTASVRSGIGPAQVLASMFPCGSVTGAPKIRAMEVIRDQELGPRGPYTGSIGRMGADGGAAFNVAIRTLVIPHGSGTARVGLGSGIVADSTAAEEWAECLRKGDFVATPDSFALIETMRVEAGGSAPMMKAHLSRLERSAVELGFAFDRARISAKISEMAAGGMPGRLRLVLSRDGGLSIGLDPLPDTPNVVEVVLAARSVARDDFRLFHKTTDRAFHDAARMAVGAFECVFVDEEGFVTEGSFTSVFVERDGRLLTPPVARGLLPGVLRETLLSAGIAVERDLQPADLETGLFIGNALRGLVRARLRS
jgi:para-aminobenzoate synthetase/4-amino-4-deoxychorismate lyase